MPMISLANGQTYCVKGRRGPRPAIGPRETNGRRSRAAIPSDKKYIYVMTAPNGAACKIGFSNNPARRCGVVQVSNSVPIKIFWSIFLDNEVAEKVERRIHKDLEGSDVHLRGEWYSMKPETAVSVIKTAISDFGA